MYYWLATMCHPDGNISYFNDSTLGVAATLSEVQEYATRLTLRSEVPATSNCISLSESGYYRVSSGNSKFLIDVGKIGPSYQPGHGHADILSFEMSVGNKRCIVNRGVSTYASGPLRLAQRGSVSHSTILLEGKNSSDVWSSFRVGARAKPIDTNISLGENNLPKIGGSHTGFGTKCNRTWDFKENRLILTDTFDDRFEQAIALFHLSPRLEITSSNKTHIATRDFELSTRGGLIDIESSYWCASFGHMIPSKCIKIKFSEPTVVTTICWK